MQRTETESQLELNLINILEEKKYKKIKIKNENDLLDNFKKQETKSSQNEKNLQTLKAVSTGLEDQLSSINQKIQLAEDLQLKITLLTNELNKQKQVIETNQSSIDAVDSYRIQNNQKVADVLNRLNGLTRDLQAIETELKAIKEEGSNEQSP